MLAPLTSKDDSLSASALPQVTAVHVTVEGARQYAAGHSAEAVKRLQSELLGLMRR